MLIGTGMGIKGMAFGDFFVRHRTASAAAALTTLGVAAAAAVIWAPESEQPVVDTQLRSSVTECHDMVTISVAGRGDTPKEGTTALLVDANGNPLPAALSGDHKSEWLDPVVNAPSDDVGQGSYAAVYIAYPANMATYEDAVNTGVANTEQVMGEISAACPDTKFSIVGYSEGADVVRRVAMKIGNEESGVNPDDVLGVVILADSGRQAGEGPFIGAEDPFSNPDGFDRKYQNGANPISGQGALPGTSGDFGKLNGKIASFCSEGDLTCAAPQNISLLQLVVNVGRQVNADQLEREGLTPATGQDVAVVLGRIAMTAFSDIAAQPNWMASDETFLEVLLRVSDPAYKPGEHRAPAQAENVAAEGLSPLAYLPQKIFNEIVGLIVTNQNTIPVILSDPYNLTLGPNGSGHHFDYWRDAKPEDGKELTSAEYAAAWLTELAKKAQAGEPVERKAEPLPAVQGYTNSVQAAASKTTSTTKATSATTGTTVSKSGVTSSTTAPSTTPAESSTTSPESTTTTPESTTTAPESTTTSPESSTTSPESSTTAPSTSVAPSTTATTSAESTTANAPIAKESEVPTTVPSSTTTAPSSSTTTTTTTPSVTPTP